MKKLIISTTILAAILLLTSVNSTAQTTRIKFKRSSNSATFSGILSGDGGARTFVLQARSGQSVTATVSSKNGKIDFTERDVHDTQFQETVETNGDVRIIIDNHGGGGRASR